MLQVTKDLILQQMTSLNDLKLHQKLHLHKYTHFGRATVKLYPCLIKHIIMKTYRVVEVHIHAFVTSLGGGYWSASITRGEAGSTRYTEGCEAPTAGLEVLGKRKRRMPLFVAQSSCVLSELTAICSRPNHLRRLKRSKLRQMTLR